MRQVQICSNSAYTVNGYNKKAAAIEELVNSAAEEDVRSFIVAVLAENEKLLLRFRNTINRQVTMEDVSNYIRQVNIITDRYLGENILSAIMKRTALYQSWKKLLMKIYIG